MSQRMIVTIVVVILAMIGLFALCDLAINDESEVGDLGAPAYVMDRGDGDDNRGGRNKNGRDCEGSEDCSTFSPSFEDSPIVICVQPEACRFG